MVNKILVSANVIMSRNPQESSDSSDPLDNYIHTHKLSISSISSKSYVFVIVDRNR